METGKHTTIWLEDDLMEKLRNYAYTERITIKEAVNTAVKEFLRDKTGILKRPER